MLREAFLKKKAEEDAVKEAEAAEAKAEAEATAEASRAVRPPAGAARSAALSPPNLPDVGCSESEGQGGSVAVAQPAPRA